MRARPLVGRRGRLAASLAAPPLAASPLAASALAAPPQLGPQPPASRPSTSLACSRARPSLPFLAPPKASPAVARSFTSGRRRWLRHEAKLVARYTVALWGLAAAVATILFAINEEAKERRFPTPHDWSYLTRKLLRDAHDFADPRSGDINWARALELARGVVVRLEDAAGDGAGVAKLSDARDEALAVPDEFTSCDVSAKPDEWRRGYVDAVMLAAKAAEHVDGWVRDTSRNVVSPPEFVIGPSNPRPRPIPPGSPRAPREDDCEPAYPPADRWYTKLLATRGLSARQRIDAALELASFADFKGRADAADTLYRVALAEAAPAADAPALPYDAQTLTLRAGPPSANLLDVLTALASHKARRGDAAAALPIYLSLLRARRALAAAAPAPPPAPHEPLSPSLLQQAVALVTPPAYPPPPPDGSLPPWRSPEERCREAELGLYIGEILYATAPRPDGLAWTRDAVDVAEAELRALGPAAGVAPLADAAAAAARRVCRQCLATGLDNWAAMVARLARDEAAAPAASRPRALAFWGAPPAADGRWAAEEAVVQERKRRTKELLDDVAPPPPTGILSLLKA